jgi:CHAT domain-containing protein
VREALSSNRVVHVASHGVLNAVNPMFSRVELAPPKRVTRSDDDGRLEIHELLGLTVRSPLVFLSGCETSAVQEWMNDPVRGTDHSSLAQALLYAGAENVVGTLWRIEDEGAAVFAERFYRALQRHDPRAAMVQAQREMADDARYADPYYWASYVLSGSGNWRP